MRKSAIFIAVLLVLSTGAAVAESLWTSATNTNTYADRRAAKVGDIVTIIITESAASTQQASTNTSKTSDMSVDPGIGPLLSGIPGLGYSDSDSMKASGSTSRSTQFSAKMTATITAVDANGNLQLEGKRLVQTNKEKQEIKLTGTVRQQDITPDNTILSTYIANASISYVGSGPIGSRQKEGLVTKIFRILF